MRTVATQAIPCHSGRVAASRWISLLAVVNASRILASIGPVWRSSRVLTMLSATSAAFPPAACPPTPSMTPNRPRAPSTYRRSSLTARSRPGSVLPAALSEMTDRVMVSARPTASSRQRPRAARGRPREPSGARPSPHSSELEKNDAGEPDACGVRQRRLGAVLPLHAVDLLESSWNVPPVECRAERAQVDEVEPAALRIPSNARVLARNVGGRSNAKVHGAGDAAAANHHAVGHDV